MKTLSQRFFTVRPMCSGAWTDLSKFRKPSESTKLTSTNRGLFNPEVENHVVAEVICGHCLPTDDQFPEQDQFYRQVYKDQGYSRPDRCFRYVRPLLFTVSVSNSTQLPRTYEALRRHISRFHRSFLSSFEAGWESLSPSLKTKWLSHTPKDDSRDHSETWMSWAYYAFSQMPVEDRNYDRNANSNNLSLYLRNAMGHEGELFGISREHRTFTSLFHYVEPDDESRTARPGISKLRIAERLSVFFERRIRRECEQWLKDTVTRGGVGALRPLLEGESILDVIANSRVNK
jgi:hypothetical protein